jgi:hypothetical protein
MSRYDPFFTLFTQVYNSSHEGNLFTPPQGFIHVTRTGTGQTLCVYIQARSRNIVAVKIKNIKYYKCVCVCVFPPP